MSFPGSTRSIAILGTGFGGLGMAIHLKKAGFSRFTVFEKAKGVGGVWRDNTYPGAACDVPSHLYSFSFAPKHDWSRRFAPQDEILSYLDHCADAYGIRSHIRFETEIASAEYDEARRLWRLTTTDGEQHEAEVLIAACGQLHRPAYPSIDGLTRFRGASFHSARWDHARDLRGTRIGVVGTGASAIQFVPRIAPAAARLTLFQRSAPYVLRKPDRSYLGLEHLLHAAMPWTQKLDRALQYGQHEVRAVPFTVSPSVMRMFEWEWRRHLRAEVRDPALRAKLVPDYPIGCKRVLMANDWYRTLCRPNVEVVTDAIATANETGLVTADGRQHELDVLIYGTGFRATELLAPMRVAGRGGQALADAWRDGPEAHLGITVAGFPNLFLLYGPNTNLGHNSILFMLESQMAYVMSALSHLETTKARTLEVRAEVQRAFVERVQTRSEATVFAESCTSWYKNEAGRNTNNWPGFTVAYRAATRRLDPAEYAVEA